MANRVLVTGGAGFIASHLVDLLLADDKQVTVLDDFSVGLRENLSSAERSGRLRIVEGSICNSEAVSSAVAGCDQVYHLAVQCVRRSLGRPIESHDVNSTGTITVLDAARAAGVKRFVYCSSSEVYGNASNGLLNEDRTVCRPMTVYGAAKLAGELYADAYWRTYQLPTVVVRPFNAYGPRAYQTGTRAEVLPRFIGRILNGRAPVIFGDATNGRDFTDVVELASGIKRAGDATHLVGETINLAFGKMITIREVAATALAVLGRNDLSVEHFAARPGDVHQLHADTAKAERLLGFKAKVGFDEGVTRYVAWVKTRFPDPAALLEQDVVNWSSIEPKIGRGT